MKATKKEYDKRIETLSENIKAKEDKLSCEITHLSEENEELRSKLKAMQKEYDKDIFKNICQPTELTICMQEVSLPLAFTLTKQSLLFNLTDLAAKTYTNNATSVYYSHASKMCINFLVSIKALLYHSSALL